MLKSKCLEYASMHTANTKDSTHVYDTNDIESETLNDFDYDTMFEDDSVIDEIIIEGTTY